MATAARRASRPQAARAHAAGSGRRACSRQATRPPCCRWWRRWCGTWRRARGHPRWRQRRQAWAAAAQRGRRSERPCVSRRRGAGGAAGQWGRPWWRRGAAARRGPRRQALAAATRSCPDDQRSRPRSTRWPCLPAAAPRRAQQLLLSSRRAAPHPRAAALGSWEAGRRRCPWRASRRLEAAAAVRARTLTSTAGVREAAGPAAAADPPCWGRLVLQRGWRPCRPSCGSGTSWLQTTFAERRGTLCSLPGAATARRLPRAALARLPSWCPVLPG